MSCRVAMLRMQAGGVLQLPPPRNSNHNGKPFLRHTAQAEPGTPLRADRLRALGARDTATLDQHAHGVKSAQ
jgi:hypothetical protein